MSIPLILADVTISSDGIPVFIGCTAGLLSVITVTSKTLKNFKSWLDTLVTESTTRIVVRIDSVEARLSGVENEIAPTNGDRRSISDRLDTVKKNQASTSAWLESNLNILPLAGRFSDTPHPDVHPVTTTHIVPHPHTHPRLRGM